MKQKRGKDEWFPIGDVFSGQDGLEQELQEASPQAAYHFTRLDQVDQLVEASEDDPDVGFMARLIALCPLPRTNPRNRKEYARHNGPYSLVMSAGALKQLPYGNLPRLLLAWVCTEAVKAQSRELTLGRSLSRFMRQLGITSDSGGKRGEMTRMREQMDRLFSASVTLIYQGESNYRRISSFVADKHELWWNPKRPNESTLWESTIRLGEEFFKEIIRRPVPLDMNVLKALKRSSLGLDLYLWLTYRTFSLNHALQLPWKRLYRQFGVDPAKADDNRTVQAFRTDCLRELTKIKAAWRELKCSTGKGVLIVSPSKPLISSKEGEI